MTLEPSPAARPPILSVLSSPSPDWDSFIAGEPGAPIYLRSGWALLARDVFRHDVFFLESRNCGRLSGILPIVRQRSLIANFATSVPFFNYGGVLTRDADLATALMSTARELVRELGCSHLEIRDVAVRDDGWLLRTDKVAMILRLPPSADALAKQLGSKLRAQIKRSNGEGFRTRIGSTELLEVFYDVFCRNMRDLGTPVYPKRFFATILERFPDNTRIVALERGGVGAAAGFLVFERNRAEIPWASCRSEFKSLGVNMKLYWEVLSEAIASGCDSFDFGRSTVDSGTFRFKKQWGAQPVQLYWHRWERNPSPREQYGGDSHGRLMRCAIAAWRRLPLRVANTLGPLVSPGLPW
jgi:serine/alanine adding enzyme